MDIPDPKSPQDAAKQARILERAKRLFADGYRAYLKPDEQTIIIETPNNEQYTICTIFESCSCPYYLENLYCKHSLGYIELLKVQQEQNEMLMTLAEEEAYGELVLQSDRYDREVRETGFNPY